MTGILPIATAAPAIEMQDIHTGIILTFDDCFALSAAIINIIRDLAPDERAETIADMQFFAAFAPERPDTIKALSAFWRTLADLFELEEMSPKEDDETHHLERQAATHLMSAGIRDIHLPGCATFMVN
jgi:hypothetical protein